MAGPIIEALRRFRENRPERVAARRSFIRDLINPLASIDQTDRMQGVSVVRRPLLRGGAFASLGGVQTANHAHKGRAQVMPPPRKMQDDPAGPDTTPSRAYDGDGTGTPMQVTPVSRPRNAQPEEPDRTYGTAAPEIIRSEASALPAPASNASEPANIAALRQRLAEADARIGPARQHLGSLGDQGATNYPQVAHAVAGLVEERNNLYKMLSLAEAQHRATPGYKVQQAEGLMQRAFQTGDWETFDRAIAADNTYETKNGPVGDAGIGRRMAQPFVATRVWDQFQRSNGMPSDPNARAAVISAMRYAYPPVVDKEGVMNWEQSVNNIVRDLNSRFNHEGNADRAKYFRNLAIVTIGPDPNKPKQTPSWW